jgi:N-acetyl sugar amidotransferase
MKMIKYCVNCVTPSTRPHIEFDENSLCSACQTAKKKEEKIDWAEREKALGKIFDKHRKNTPGVYDCIIGVSGGKDSTYQVHTVKNVYKMNPLCITFRTLARTPRGEENLQALRNMGVDHMDFSPNPVGVNKLTKKAFDEFGDSSLLDHLAIYSIIANLAVKLRLPLVVWGENPWMEYGGSREDSESTTLNTDFLKRHNILKGRSVEDWVDDDLKIEEVQSMIYPSDQELDEIGYTPIYLGYYLAWDAKHNVEIAQKYGFKPREKGPIMGLYDYADLDCMNIVIHHYFKWLKFGFNRVTDNASNEIRKGRMTRDEAIELVRKHDGDKPPVEYIQAFCKQIGITEEYFWATAERFRNHDIWRKDENGEWFIEGWIGGDKVLDRFPHVEA